MHVKVDQVGDALHPEEVVISVKTREGEQKLAVDRRSVNDASLRIGWPVGQKDEFYLVELPRETFQGFWRVWVRKTDVSGADRPVAAVG